MNNYLNLTEEEMRQLGYKAVDMLVNHFVDVENKHVARKESRNTLEEIFREPIPVDGSDPFKLLDRVEKDVFNNIMHLDHPRFFAFVSSPSNYISVLADFLAAGFNVFSGTWLEASAPSQIELVTIGWLTELFGLPQKTSGGLFLSGGSMANLTGLSLAAHHKNMENKIGVVYASDQTHSSIERACKVLGHERILLKKLACKDFMLDLTQLKKQVVADKTLGLHPMCVVANAGTTNTGAIDNLSDIEQICTQENMWFHVDGSYGGAAMLSQLQREKFEGIANADSIGIDPHKWLFQPYEIGCLLVRDSRKLKDLFYILPEYLKDIDRSEEEINYSNYGIQLTRGFRAFKMWLSLKTFGIRHFQRAIEHGISMAELAEDIIGQYSHWEIVSPAHLGIINFRFITDGVDEIQLNGVNQKIIDTIVQSGFAMISSTILNKKTVIRLCMINPRTRKEDVNQTIERLNQIAKRWL